MWVADSQCRGRLRMQARATSPSEEPTRSGPRARLDQLGDDLSGSGRTVCLDVDVVDALADQLSDPGSDDVGVARRVVHAFAGPIAVQAVAYMKVLLEVLGEREVEERALGRGLRPCQALKADGKSRMLG